MNRRIEEIRRDVGLSQEAFGERLNVSMNYVWMIENGKRIPSERLIKSICREFGVNEEWLRTGEGEMLSPSEEFDLAEYAKSKGATDLELRIVKAYFALPEDVRRAVMQSLSKTFRDAFPEPAAEPRNVHDWTRAEMDAEYTRQADAEEADRKKGTDATSTGSPRESGADCA